MSFSNNMALSKLLSALWTPSVPLASPSKLPCTGLQDSCTKGFHFLIRLAWESRYLLPVMYAVFFFLFDVQMRLEIIIHRERRMVLVEEEVPAEPERNVDAESDGNDEDESDNQAEQDDEGDADAAESSTLASIDQ